MYTCVYRTMNLIFAISIMILPLNSTTEEHGSIVDEIRRVLCQIQHHEIKIQSHHTKKLEITDQNN